MPSFFHPYVVLLLVSLFFVGANGAGCIHCKDSAGFPDHVSAHCPFIKEGGSNSASIEAGNPITIASSLLPDQLLRLFPPGVLKVIVNKASSTSQTAFQITSTSTFLHIMDAVKSCRLSKNDALDHFYGKLESETDATQISKFNGYIKALQDLAEVGADTIATGSYLSGCFTYLLAIVSKYVMVIDGVASLLLSEEKGGSVSLLKATHYRPSRFSEFVEMLHYYLWLSCYSGLVALPVMARFLTKVVWVNIRKRLIPWQIVHELLLIVLRAVEQSRGQMTLGNVMEIGSQDSFMREATVAAEEHYPGATKIFRSPGGNPGNVKATGGEKPEKAKEFNGKDTPTSNKCCFSFNLGTDHPASSLHKDGTCKFKHACDHFISGHGPNARCSSTKHGRHSCNHPNKCDTPEK
jgi:hypothetical protein